ncbi:MAG: peptide ABC transporter substrate-binding protein [Actinobacteria bacterium]|nr:peptide ABC transporter substrate-binding protein [Actinomycetota bacterium]
MDWRKLTVFGVIIAMVGVLAAGCAGGATTASEQVIKYNDISEPETLDPAKSTGVPEANYILQFMEGLTRYDKNGQPKAGIAETWEVSPDGTEYTFHLRDAQWSNGDPVTADDFVFAWKRALDPNTAADYAYQLYYLKNGQAFNEGKATADEVGVKAVDPKTLSVTLEAPATYFLGLAAFPTLMPLPKKVVEANENWWTSADTLVANGPFKIVNWQHNDRVEFEPNEKYWDAKSVKLKKLIYYMVDDESTELTMFDTGEIDYADTPPLAEIDSLKAKGLFKVAPYLGTYYYLFQTEKDPVKDARVRRALAYAVDRKSLVENVTKGGQVPAMAFVPAGIPDGKSKKDFREVGGDYFKDNDVEAAKKLLGEAGYPDGKGFPTLEILYNTLSSHKSIAEAISEMWKKSLNIPQVTMTNQEWKVYLQTRDEGNYQVARAGWLADYVDPMTFLDMWTKDNGNNNTFWSDDEYDRLVGEARRDADLDRRAKTMHKLEEILMRDMPIMPIYFYTNPYLLKDWVKDVIQSPLGFIDFKYAYVTKH